MKKFNDCFYLTNDFGLIANDCPEEKKLTYRLKCPSVFGDEVEHEFVTYWEIPVLQNKFAKAICNRIEFEGKVFTPTLTQDGYSYRVTIILEDKSENKKPCFFCELELYIWSDTRQSIYESLD